MKLKKTLQDNHIRTLTKAITYRGLIMFSDGIVVGLLTHRYDLAIGMILISNVASTVLYMAHERVWNRISWGQQ